jgi:hypothetical protein
MTMTTEQALEATGGLSETDKMPCFSYSLPATACKLGRQLSRIPHSVCSECYAQRGRYGLPHVQKKMRERLRLINKSEWVAGMAYLISMTDHRSFRWHDSGDIQSAKHFERICHVAVETPEVRHWLPTQEHHIVQRLRSIIPDNLTVRISSRLINRPQRFPGFVASAVSTDPAKVNCPAWQQGGKCGSCRLCWSREVPLVIYPLKVNFGVYQTKETTS